MKTALPRILIAMLSAGLLLSQSLVDISKAEKERREKLKGKNVKVITNADLQSSSKKPALVTAPAEAKTDQAAGQTAAGPGEQEAPPAAQKALRSRSEGEGIPYARQVLPESYLVENPERALNYPDGQYAEISMLGLLDLEFSARNGTGNDIAIYARLAGLKELQEAQAQQEEGLATYATDFQYWEGFWYGVLVMGENGDWEVIGQGTGRSSPETFELGRFQSITKIRLMFKPHNNPDLPFKLPRLTPAEFTVGIDAVEALH